MGENGDDYDGDDDDGGEMLERSDDDAQSSLAKSVAEEDDGGGMLESGDDDAQSSLAGHDRRHPPLCPLCLHLRR